MESEYRTLLLVFLLAQQSVYAEESTWHSPSTWWKSLAFGFLSAPAEPLNQPHEPKPQFPQLLKGGNKPICSLALGPIKCSDKHKELSMGPSTCDLRKPMFLFCCRFNSSCYSHRKEIIPEAFRRHMSLHGPLVLGIHAPRPVVPSLPLRGPLSAWNIPYPPSLPTKLTLFTPHFPRTLFSARDQQNNGRITKTQGFGRISAIAG